MHTQASPSFQPSRPFTLGLELELQVLDPETLDLCPGAPDLLARVPADLAPFLKPEAYRSTIELVTPVCPSFAALEGFLRQGLAALEDLAHRNGYLLFAAGLHPFARAERQVVSDDQRYRGLFRELELVGRRFIAQGMHLHVGLPDASSATALYNALLPYLPLLLALTTSSPFFEGQPTGFHSYRTKLFEVLPLAGLPRPFRSWAEFAALLGEMVSLGIVESPRDLWWDVRLQPDLGTVEVRICDTPGRFRDLLAVSALVLLLARRLTEDQPPPLPRELVLYGKWQAARHGLAGRMVHPRTRRLVELRQMARELARELAPLAADLGLASHLALLEELADRGPASCRMLALHRGGANLAEIVSRLREEFWL